MTPLCSTNLLRFFYLLSAYLLVLFCSSTVQIASGRYRSPIAEVDPDAVIRDRTRGNNQEHNSALTSGVSDTSFSLDDSVADLLHFWNLSSFDEAESDGELVGELPPEDQGATLEEEIIPLLEEDGVEIDPDEFSDDVLAVLAARRSRPSTRLAPSRRKKKNKKRNQLSNMYSPLSNKHKQRILAMHNSYRRRSPGPASNMEEMKWDEELTLMSKKYAKKCIWAHGQAMDSTQFKHVGQNLAYGKNARGITITPFYLVSLWYQEKNNYDINTDTCEPNTLCGHYTQMIWSDTNKLGCATNWCSELTIPGSSMVIRDALYLVCNYGPGGNIHGHLPYEIGIPCTECASGSGKCRDGLCSDCDLSESSCDCMLECQNGGILDEENCQCTCPAGWIGPSCEDVCNNTHAWCGNGWPKEWCFNQDDNNPVEELCPAMCGVCECGGPPCINGGRKSVYTCQCECPAPWGGPDCSECNTKCVNGVMDEESCHCTCEDGWMGPSCSEPCGNLHQLCYHGWYPNWCDDEHPYVQENCPAMCGLCKLRARGNVRASNSGNCRKQCKNGGTLRRGACRCDCVDGWFGDDCSLECRDEFHHCSWATHLCENRDYARHYCPVSCELCTTPIELSD